MDHQQDAGDVRLASRGRRLVAWLVDLALFWVPPAVGALGHAGSGDRRWVLLLFVGWLTVPLQCVLIATLGQTVGKRVLGLRVVDRTGHAPGWISGLVAREGVRLAPLFVPLLGVGAWVANAMLALGDDQRPGHDRLAKTWVVQLHGGAGPRLRDVRDLPTPPLSPRLRLGIVVAATAAVLAYLAAAWLTARGGR